MKSKIIPTGKEIELPEIFSSSIRPDIAQKVYESQKVYQPFAPYYLAGKTHSASGIIKRHRKVWKTGYGHGLSRVPRKIVWRRGTQFNWIGATVANTVGGRRAHPPRVEHFQKEIKINKKEQELALASGISASTNESYIKRRYSRVDKIETNLPLVISSDLLKLKSVKFFESIEKSLGNLIKVAYKQKMKRAGKGKLKGNKYRKTAGMLLVIGTNEKYKVQGMDIRKVSELSIADFYPLGRLTIYTENAVKELGVKEI